MYTREKIPYIWDCIYINIGHLIYLVLSCHKQGCPSHLCTSLHGDLCDFSGTLKGSRKAPGSQGFCVANIPKHFPDGL